MKEQNDVEAKEKNEVEAQPQVIDEAAAPPVQIDQQPETKVVAPQEGKPDGQPASEPASEPTG